jgi:hypothetical protein
MVVSGRRMAKQKKGCIMSSSPVLDELAAAAKAVSEKYASTDGSEHGRRQKKRPVSAEKRLREHMMNGKPANKEEALEAFALMMAAGRVKAPSVVSTSPSHLNEGEIPSF